MKLSVEYQVWGITKKGRRHTNYYTCSNAKEAINWAGGFKQQYISMYGIANAPTLEVVAVMPEDSVWIG